MAENYTSIYKTDGILDGNISYYAVDTEAVKTQEEGKFLIPPTSAVINAFYMPYVKSTDYTTVSINISKIKLPTGENKNVSQIVERVTSFNALNGIVGKCKIQQQKPTTVGGDFTWKNESKLWLYPYTFYEIYDGLSTPVHIQPQRVNQDKLTNGEQTLLVRSALNQQGQYLLYFEGYCGDNSGLSSGWLCDSIQIPTSSSAYTDYMAFNSNQIQAQRMGLLLNGAMAVGSVATGNIIGGLTSAVGVGMSAYQMWANERDLAKQPNQYSSVPSNYAFNLCNNKDVVCRLYQYQDRELERIGLYFNQYGYAQNKIMQPSFKGRKYWNYLQTSDCHLKVANCPKEHLQQLKQIFDNGVTVHHWESGEMFENTEKDNVEV